jgi:hypothetical protein
MRQRNEASPSPDSGRDKSPPLLAFLPALLTVDYSLPDATAMAAEPRSLAEDRPTGPTPSLRSRRTV